MATDLRDLPDVVDGVIEYTITTKNTAKLIRLLRQQEQGGDYIDQRLAKLIADVLDGTVRAKRKTATRDVEPWVYRGIVGSFSRAIEEGQRDALRAVAERRLPIDTKGQRTTAARAIAADVFGLSVRQLRERIERPKGRGKRG